MKNYMSMISVLFIVLSVMTSSCAQMSAGDWQLATSKSTILASKSGDIFIGYYEIPETLHSYYVMVSKSGTGYIPSIERLPTETVKNTIRAMTDTGLFTRTTWDNIPAPVQIALFNFGRDYIQLPLGAPLILAPMMIIITPVPTPVIG